MSITTMIPVSATLATVIGNIEKTIRTCLRSDDARAISSPVGTLSWKLNASRCTCSNSRFLKSVSARYARLNAKNLLPPIPSALRRPTAMISQNNGTRRSDRVPSMARSTTSFVRYGTNATIDIHNSALPIERADAFRYRRRVFPSSPMPALTAGSRNVI